MNKNAVTKKKSPVLPVLTLILIAGAVVMGLMDHEAGLSIGKKFMGSAKTMITILPLTFILISLFDVWVEREKIEKHLGEGGGWISYVWVYLLGSTTIGPMIVSLPVAAALHRKGARFEVIFTYLGAASVCRIPMTLFEASYLGVKFTLIRYAVALPLILVTAKIFAVVLKRTDYKITDPG